MPELKCTRCDSTAVKVDLRVSQKQEVELGMFLKCWLKCSTCGYGEEVTLYLERSDVYPHPDPDIYGMTSEYRNPRRVDDWY